MRMYIEMKNKDLVSQGGGGREGERYFILD